MVEVVSMATCFSSAIPLKPGTVFFSPSLGWLCEEVSRSTVLDLHNKTVHAVPGVMCARRPSFLLKFGALEERTCPSFLSVQQHC